MNFDDEKKNSDENRSRDLSPGKLLVWARERANLTSEQVAKELYMTLTKVRALESDDYRHMGADTFTRGYLRAYANLVQLDVVQVLAAYDRHAQKHGLVEELVPLRRVESANKPLWQFALLMLLVLLAFWLVSVWFFDNRQEESYERAAAVLPSINYSTSGQSAAMEAEVTQLAPAELEIKPVQEAVEEGGASAQISSAAGVAPPVQLNAPAALTNTAVVASEMTDAKPASAKTNVDTIVFEFEEECWLEVSDARGDVLVADLRAAGSHLQLRGKAPFDVKLGNAPGAKITLNGDAIELVPALGTNVLSLKIGQKTEY